MALQRVPTVNLKFCHAVRALAAASASLMVSACAQQGSMLGLPELASSSATQSHTANASSITNNRSELQRATAYWGKEYANNPQDLNAALSYVRNLKAMNQKRQALAVLQNASRFHGRNRELASEYGRLALDLGQITVAEKVLTMAEDPANPDWRIISARGTILAKRGEYSEAIPFYERALAIAPGRPSLLNNLAMAYIMKGDPQKAESLLRQASATNGSTGRVRQNLALALGLQGKYSESTQVASQDTSPAAASHNTSAIRKLVNLPPKHTPPPQNATTLAASNLDLKPTATAQTNGWQTEIEGSDVASTSNVAHGQQ